MGDLWQEWLKVCCSLWFQNLRKNVSSIHMMALTSRCGDDGNALKHSGIQLRNINLSLATVINIVPSAESRNAEGDVVCQERPVIYNGPCLCFITASVENNSWDWNNPSFFHQSSSLSHNFFSPPFCVMEPTRWSTHQNPPRSLFSAFTPLCVFSCVWCCSSLIVSEADTYIASANAST